MRQSPNSKFVLEWCCYCNRELKSSIHSSQYAIQKTVEHLIPRSHLKVLHKWNTLPCCIVCNNWRGNLPYGLWILKVDAILNSSGVWVKKLNGTVYVLKRYHLQTIRESIFRLNTLINKKAKKHNIELGKYGKLTRDYDTTTSNKTT